MIFWFGAALVSVALLVASLLIHQPAMAVMMAIATLVLMDAMRHEGMSTEGS